LVYEADLAGDVGLAVLAMKSGAADVLQSPVDLAVLLLAVASALSTLRDTEQAERVSQAACEQIAHMSRREREVLDGLLGGGTNKTIARDLGISPRTVEIYRARVMERLGAHTVPEAVLAAAAAGLRPGPARQLP
jgi:FixJ family two-component response regulator